MAVSALPLLSQALVRGQPQTAPSCHPSCQPEGQCCRPAWQEKKVSATYHGVWTGVPQRPVDETEGFEVEERKSREEMEKFGAEFIMVHWFNPPLLHPWFLTPSFRLKSEVTDLLLGEYCRAVPANSQRIEEESWL